jgi:Cu+-exporting ATPase
LSSEHPLASAILAAARKRRLTLPRAEEFRAEAGKGVQARVNSSRVVFGDLAMMGSKIPPSGSPNRADGLAGLVTRPVVFTANRLVVVVAHGNPLHIGSARALERKGLRIVMVTGDNRTTADAVAKHLGLDEVRAEILPAGKRAVVQELQAAGRVVAMAGDGINDAPALAEAAVGIAMGTGTDVAIESAGVTLLSGDLRGIVWARRLSRATMRNIRQNLFLAFVYNAIGVPVAAGVLCRSPAR